MSSRPFRLTLAAAFPVALLLCVGTTPAHAAACANDLTVAGKPVSGSDCVTAGNGDITITNPVLGTNKNVKIQGAASDSGDAKMILNSGRTKLVPENVAKPVRLTVGSTPVMVGITEFSVHDFCDLAEQRAPSTIQSFQQAGSVGEEYTGEPLLPQTAGCRPLPSFKFSLGMFGTLGRIVGLDLGAEHGFVNLKNSEIQTFFGENNANSFVFRVPRVFLVDDERGGRVQGVFDLELPKPFRFKQEGSAIRGDDTVQEVPIRIGVGAEVSAAEGVKLTSLAIDIPQDLPLPVPGVKIRDLLAVIDPTNNRFGGGARLVLPGNKAFGGEFVLNDGRVERIGVDLGFPTPGIPIFVPPVLFLSSVGATFVGGTHSDSGPANRQFKTPFSIQGRMKALVGPSIAGEGAFSLDSSLTVSGPKLKLVGVVSALGNAIKLADAKITIGMDPFRFEADGNVNVKKSVLTLNGRLFAGITKDHVTGLGDLTARIPDKVPLVGGQTLGGLHAAISEKGVGAVAVIDPPVFDPYTLGFGTNWSPIDIKVITSIQQFITVNPSAASAAAAGDGPVAIAAAQRSIRIKRPERQLNVTLTGAGAAPRAAKFLSGRRKLRAAQVGRHGKVAEYALLKVPRGTLRVKTAGRLSKIEVGRPGTFPYLDPSPGAGTRAQGPVTAGTPVNVCWKTKGNVPRGTVIDVFEDQNGSLGTGKILASGQAANGCLAVPTTGLEPGKHWVYGVVRVGGALVGTRYWPIGINIVDPTALPAPTGLTVVATPDGADVRIPPIPTASGYVVTATPADEQTGEPVEADVAVTDPTTSLELRGARNWKITALAIGPDGRPGNISDPVDLTPTDGVVLAGSPNGTPQVGKKWAFPLDTNPGTNVRLVNGPSGMRIEGGAALLQWTPSAAAGRGNPQTFTVEGCRGERCVTRTFTIEAYAKNSYPYGPARGFAVTPNVLTERGGKITIRAQGIDEKPTVKLDGRVLRGVRRVDAGTLEVKTGRLTKGPHELGLQIGQDAEERRPGAIVVL